MPLLAVLGFGRIFRERPIIRAAALSCLLTFGFYYDIEGGEQETLSKGFRANVLHLLFEWHSGIGAERTLASPDLVAGNWMKLSSDPYGSSMWYFRR